MFDRAMALAYLLNTDNVVINTRPYIENPWVDKDKQTVGGPTIVVFANCSNVFVWGSADAEPINIGDDDREHCV